MTTRVVLDTNIVLSALLFTSGRIAWIRQAWLSGEIRPVVCKQTVSEFLRTLAYPKFKLTGIEQEEMLADFLPYAETYMLEKIPKHLPECRDKDDQVFLVLAACPEWRYWFPAIWIYWLYALNSLASYSLQTNSKSS